MTPSLIAMYPFLRKTFVRNKTVNIRSGYCKGRNLIFIPHCDWNVQNLIRCLNI